MKKPMSLEQWVALGLEIFRETKLTDIGMSKLPDGTILINIGNVGELNPVSVWERDPNANWKELTPQFLGTKDDEDALS